MSMPDPILSSSRMLEQEARALLTRLARVKPFALKTTMVAAAAIPPSAQTAIERFLIAGRGELRWMVREFLRWLKKGSQTTSPEEIQRRFTALRLHFLVGLTHFDIFADVLTQRSESETGVWLSGLDVAAADGLKLAENYYDAPPVICYLDRGHGAAIRRARTRLPGGEENPVAVVRVPRERMIGSGIGSSLLHEVGHQASALLDLVESMRVVLRSLQRNAGAERIAWRYWDRTISEVLADFWSVAKLGITSTLGLIGVVSLPRYFVFRLNLGDPHPVPWIRVKLSCAMGKALYPHAQWQRLEQLWESLYPVDQEEKGKKQLLALLAKTIPGLAGLIASHRPRHLRGASLAEALQVNERTPRHLQARFYEWRTSPIQMERAPPSLVLAVIGQARADGRISPEEEARTLTTMLTHWALHSALDTSAACAAAPQSLAVHQGDKYAG